jgi:predicted AlkP superfamily pyrophosphatase or phosphodiesterase
MSRKRVLARTFWLCCVLLAAVTRGEPSPRHVLMVSIDGMMPRVYTEPDAHGLRVPNLRRLAAEGAFAAGVIGVLPTVTYPSHATLITGVPPSRHGIVGNTVFDPAGISDDSWYWYARQIRVPTLVDAVRATRRLVGSVSWPVSVGLGADFLLPAIWRNRSAHPADLELIRALTTPGLIEAAEAARGAPLSAPLDDDERTDVALTILRTYRPALLLVHLLEVDSAAHKHGPSAAETRAAIEAADGRLGKLLAALDELRIADQTLVAVVSDHGFLDVERIARPNTLLVEHGLATLDDKGNAATWKAWFHSHGGSAALYLSDPTDRATARRVRELLRARMAQPDSGIRAILEADEVAALGGDPAAELFLDAADGFSLSRTAQGGWYGVPVERGYHGYAPGREALHASAVLRAPQLARRGNLGVIRITQIAATVAHFLGVRLTPEAGPSLQVWEQPPSGQLDSPHP